ncbi:MAG: cysteine desulfurase-like protein SufS subfamily [Acidimicrobiaceae bacterium]|nr:cysteine desulfurase-like protein SufS subfamily [Acidimicrobiaceae bacterium]
MSSFNVRRIRADIPLLQREINGRKITYLDSGASSLQPHAVIDAMSRYYELRHANVHRGVYQTANEATEAYEGSRAAVALFLNAPGGADEVVFTKNTTESLNLIAKTWGADHLAQGDVVLVSEMEHHANIVPWFQLREATGVEVRFIPVGDDYRLDLTKLDELLDGVKLLSVTAMSNVLGTKNPIAELAEAAHRVGALIAVDGAQSIVHGVTDVQELDIDFLAFSGHKMLGPTGIGVLWTRESVLDTMGPFMGGGGMIADVRVDGFTPAKGVARFEAGTPPIAESVGLRAAVRYLTGLGMENVADHDHELTVDALTRLESSFDGRVRVIGPSDTKDRGGVISLDVEGVHPHDVAQVLDQFGVCVRPGHHCAKPLMKRFGLAATARASFGPYSTTRDTDVLLEALTSAVSMFG